MSSFGKKARSAVIWNLIFNLFRDLVQFFTMIVLVRILMPASYGQFAMVTSAMGFLSIFSHSNFVAHILQVKDDVDARYQEHFTASAVIQIGIFLVSNVVATVLHWVPTYASIAPFLHVMSLSFLLAWPSELRQRMLERDFNWKRLRLLQAVGLVGSALLGLIMAWIGAGTYALLVPGLFVTLPFIYDLFFLERWRPTWAWVPRNYIPAWRFGVARTLGGVAVRSRQLLESGILTATIGFSLLGMFNRSIGLAQMFCQKFSEQLLGAIYPILTRIDGEGLDPTRIGGLVLRVVAWVVIPIAIVFASLAEPVVNTVYGLQWAKVTVLLPWAMAWGALSAISHAAYMLLLAKNQTQMCTRLDLGMLIATAGALLLFLPYGLNVYLITLAALQLINSIVMMMWLIDLNTLSWRGVLDAFLPPTVAGVAAWTLAGLSTGALPFSKPQSVVMAICWGGFFSLSYFAVIRFVFVRQITNLISYLPGRDKISRLFAINLPL